MKDIPSDLPELKAAATFLRAFALRDGDKVVIRMTPRGLMRPGELGETCLDGCSRRWIIYLNEHECRASPLLAIMLLTHEWAHYLAWDDPNHYDHAGEWPAMHAHAHRVASGDWKTPMPQPTKNRLSC